MRKLHYIQNIYHFVFMFLVFFTFFSSATKLSSQESPAEIEILKKISSNYIKQIIESSKSLDEVAKKVGLTRDELIRTCLALSIDIDIFKEEKVEPVPVSSEPPSAVSVNKLSSPEYEPDVIIDYNGESPYVLLVEKSAHKIYLLKYEKGNKSLVGAFECKTGKNTGDKKAEGDQKTPEGIFSLVAKYNRNRIRNRVGKGKAYEYGEMAFATNFPTYIDKLNKKNGSGIWLHGTDEPFSETSSLDTRGCVVTTNETIKTLSKYIKLRRTPLIIVETLKFNKKKDHINQQKEILDMLENWRSSWEEKRLDDYIKHYSEKFRGYGRNLSEQKVHKERVFRQATINHIKLNNVVVLKHKDGMVAQFIQDYSASNNMKTINFKELYFVNDNNTWKIIAERIRN